MDDVMVVFQLCQGLLNWLLFTIGLMGILRKLKYKRPWYSWFTGLRYYAFGSALEMPVAGMVCGAMPAHPVRV